MTRALFLTHTAAPSGAELATLRLLSALHDLGQPDIAMAYTEDGPMVARTRAHGIETLLPRGRFESRAMTIGAGARRLVTGFAALLRLGWTVGGTARRIGADVLVAESSKALVMGIVAARRARIPLVWQVHDRIAADYFGRLPTLVLRVLARLCCAGYLANSRATLATLPTGRKPALVAYPGVAHRTGTARHPQRPPTETVVTVLGRLAPWKGQDVLLRALAATATRPRRVYLIGGTFFDEQPYRAELERLAADLAISVTFTGHVDDPSEYLRDTDILVHCSVLPEPFGQVIVEGMQAGCAVIAAAPGGPEEIITPGIDGLLVPGGSDAQLTAALDALIADPALRTRLADAGRLRAADFDLTTTARSVAVFLTDLAQRNDAAGTPTPPERTTYG
ncbi:glycosyltransferase [Nocardia brasiliensis]|uniref:Glycosyltransferase n=1 Tax=Nocardia brasiliensis TaxID=37326 RepID=A0A6G9XRU2_NOCBR|nr:glycosyltransferase family 4 protein [Nocardia brasiliensis]QIS03627.1 glycosyltransferase [Nocardia brasiliensis]